MKRHVAYPMGKPKKDRPKFEPEKTISAGHKRAKDKRAAKRDDLRRRGLLKQKEFTAEPPPEPTSQPREQKPIEGAPYGLTKSGKPRKRPLKNSSPAGQADVGSRA